MKFLAAVSALILAAPLSHAAFEPTEWQSSPLAKAGNKNEWYFFPDSSNEPRILVKATGGASAKVGRKLLTGGPPVWSDDLVVKIPLGRQGPFVPTGNGGGYLVAPQGSYLKVAVFDSLGNATMETIDPNPGTYTGVSAELDNAGNLHVGYIYNGRTICYARRVGPSSWNFTSQLIPGPILIHETAVVPITFSTVNLYYNQTYAGVRTLWRAKPAVAGDGRLYITWAANPLQNVENFVGLTLRGSRVGAEGRVYYFGSNNSTSWKLKRYNGTAAVELENAGFVSPKSIRVAIGPDGRQRVAWYNETLKRVHYLKPPAIGPDLPLIAGYPVVTTIKKQVAADLSGFHFTPDGTPCLLYRTTAATAFVGVPREDLPWTGSEW